MDAAALATRLITKYGRLDGALRRPMADAVAPADKPWAPEDASGSGLPDPIVARNLPVVVLDVDTFLTCMKRKVDSLAPSTTSVALLSGTSPEPLVGDVLESLGSRGRVLRVERLQPGVATALFTVHLGD